MAHSNGTSQQPEPVIVERGGGISIEWPQPAPQPPTEPSR